jgi:hypothetical protein
MVDSLIGTQLGKYEIRSEIGRGGMGAVFLGYDRPLDRWVAVKVLAPSLAWEGEFVERFLREARAAAQLSHPNIVTIHDVGQQGNWYYFVMAHLAGKPLSDVIRERGPMAVEEVLRLLRPLADALDYAHERGLIHRDVKPGNVIVEAGDQVTLTDFGIARAVAGARLTRTGALVGTPEYMSPEQATGAEVGPYTDQYALGIVAYEMLAGQVPFRAESTPALLHMLVYEPPPPLRTVRPDLTAGVSRALNRALAKDAKERYGSCGEFIGAFEAAAQAPQLAAPQPAVPPAAAPAWSGSDWTPRPSLAPRAPPSPPSARRTVRRGLPGWVWVAGGLVAAGGTLAIAAVVLALWFGPARRSRGDAAGAERAQLTADAGTAAAGATPSPRADTPVPPTRETPPTPEPTALAPTGELPTEAPPSPTPPRRSMAEHEADLLSAMRYREDNGKVVFAYPVREAPEIDGRLDEWPGRDYDIAHEHRDREIEGLIGNRSGPADLSGRFHIAWDAEHLYVGVDVVDDVHVQIERGETLFKGDDIEIQVDADLEGDWSDAALSGDDGQVGLSAGDFDASGPEAYIWLPASREQPGTMITIAALETGRGYSLEAAIPWSVLGGRPQVETPVGFCLSLSDNDIPGTAQQQTLMSTIPRRKWGDPTTWGTLVLVDWR